MKTVIFPYATLDTEPDLQLSTPTVDGEPKPLLSRQSNIDLFDLPPQWREARVNLRVRVPIEELATIGATDPTVVATLHCGATNLRVARRLEQSGDGQWTGQIVLARTLLSGGSQVYATVAGTVGGEPNRWLGRSLPVKVNLTPPSFPEIVSGGELPVVWRNFALTEEGQNPIDPALHAEISYVDLAASDGPVIYLNDHVHRLRQLLDDRRGRSGIERAVRDLVFDKIAEAALVAMFNAALAAVVELTEDGQPQFPSVEWQRGVLEALLPLMYADREPEAALADAVDAFSSVDDAQDVQSRLVAAAGRLVRASSHTVQVIRALEALGEENER
jgi:hypothetical protein